MGRSLSSLSPREAGHRIIRPLKVVGPDQGDKLAQFAWARPFPGWGTFSAETGKVLCNQDEVVPHPATVLIVTEVSGGQAGLWLPRSHLSRVPIPSWTISGLVTRGSASPCSVTVTKGRPWQAVRGSLRALHQLPPALQDTVGSSRHPPPQTLHTLPP